MGKNSPSKFKYQHVVDWLHVSLRWDRPDTNLSQYLHDILPECGFATFTEAHTKRDVFNDLTGHGVTQGRGPGPGENAILHRKHEWRRIDWDTPVLSQRKFPRRNSLAHATLGLYEHKTLGITAFVAVTHLPSGARTPGGWSNNVAQVLAYRSAIRGYKRVTRKWRKEYRPDFVFLWADWNMDARIPWQRKVITRLWPYLSGTWNLSRLNQARGTAPNGKDIIDFAVTNAEVLHATVRNDHYDVSDHAPVAVTFGIWPKKRRAVS